MKKLLLVASLLALTACGDSKVTEIDGSSTAMADQSLKAMMQGMKNSDRYNMEVDIKMLHARYTGEEFAKALGGKDKDEFQKEVAGTRLYFIGKGREREIADSQKEIDAFETQIKEWTDLKLQNRPDFVAADDVFVQGWTKKADLIRTRQAQVAALSDDAFWKEYGCGCSESSIVRPQYN